MLPGEIGFMVLTDGKLTESSGELKNDERIANLVLQIRSSLEVSQNVFGSQANSVTIQFDDHIYVLAFEKRRTSVIMRRIQQQTNLLQQNSPGMSTN